MSERRGTSIASQKALKFRFGGVHASRVYVLLFLQNSKVAPILASLYMRSIHLQG